MSETTAQTTVEPQASPQPVRNKYAGEKKKKKVPKWIKVLIPIIIIAALVATAVYFVKKFTAGTDDSMIETGFVYRGMLSSQVTGWGNVTAKEKAEYGATSRGTVTEIAIKAGDSERASTESGAVG